MNHINKPGGEPSKYPTPYYSLRLNIHSLMLALQPGEELPVVQVKEEIRGRTYVYNVSGTTQWRPIVHLHGLVGSKDNFLSQMKDPLFGSFYNIALDLHTDVQPWKKLGNIDDIIAYVHDFVVNKQLTNIVIHGVSLWGEFAYKFAATHPELVWALVLSGASWLQHENLQFANIEKAQRLSSNKEMIRRMAARQFSDTQKVSAELNTISQDIYNLLSDSQWALRVVSLAMHTQSCDISQNIATLSNIAHINIPTYLLRGKNDKITPSDKVIPQFEKAAKIPQDNIYTFPTGHTPNIECPEKYNPILKSIVEKNSQ